MKIVGMMLLAIGLSGIAMAGRPYGPAVGVPEIDAGSGMSALTLLSGVLLVVGSRRKR